MTVLDYAALEIDADVDGDGAAETGRFEMLGGLNIEEGIRTGYLVDSAGSQVYGFLVDLIGDGESGRKGVTIDFGGGQHAVEIQFNAWKGAYHPDTNTPLQWGATDDDTVLDVTSATGAPLVSQINVFMNYLRVGETDSLTPARLEFGEYHSGGNIPEIAEPLDVAVESPSLVRSPDERAVIRGTITCVETVDLNDVIDGQELTG